MNGWMIFMVGVIGMILLFLAAWLWAKWRDNYSIVDAVWAFGIGLTSFYWLFAKGNFTIKHSIAAGLIMIWSLRLGIHLERRIRRMRPAEDARYVKLREIWQGRVASSFFWFFQAQMISVVLLALPFLLIGSDLDSAWTFWESMGLTIGVTGIIGEALADAQMADFKKKNQSRAAVCQEGLWRYSRHPNYFFESVIWLGFYVFACGSEWGWAMIYAPLTILYLLLKVTGIPPTEAAAVLRKGDAYRRYQATTSAFFPWPPKKI